MDEKIIKLVNDSEKELDKEFKKIDEICEYNSLKVLNAFWNNKLSEAHFSQTTGYGYDDIGRDVIEKIYAEIFGAEDALVRSQFISGSHALTVALFAYLRPGDTMLSISGLPYDTLHEVIGIVPNDSSLKSFGVNYEQIDLINDDFDYEKIEERLNKSKIKLIEIQRSKGYSTRKSISNSKIKKVVDLIRKYDKDVIIMVDNCYCEFVDKVSPIEMGADIIVGSLIKNLGGGIAPNGAYIVGKKRLVDLAGERLTLPGEGGVFEGHVAAGGAVFGDGDGTGVQVEVFSMVSALRYMGMTAQQHIAVAQGRRVVLAKVMPVRCINQVLSQRQHRVIRHHGEGQHHLVNLGIAVSTDSQNLIPTFIQHSQHRLRRVLLRQIISGPMVQQVEGQR